MNNGSCLVLSFLLIVFSVLNAVATPNSQVTKSQKGAAGVPSTFTQNNKRDGTQIGVLNGPYYDHPILNANIPPALRTDPTKKVSMQKFNESTILIREGKYKQAAANLKYVIDHNPDLAQAYNNYAIALCYLGQQQKAAKELIIAIHIDPANKSFYRDYCFVANHAGIVAVPWSLDPVHNGEIGSFQVFNALNTPLYNFLIVTKLVSGENDVSPTSDTGEQHPVLPKKTSIIYTSNVASQLPLKPYKVRMIEIQVLFTVGPGGQGLPLKEADFIFVPRQDDRGHWDWYPDILD